MKHDIKDLEEALLSSRDEFISQQNKAVDKAREQFGKRNVQERKIETSVPRKAPRKMAPAESYKVGYVVRLGVRQKRLSLDELFEFRSNKISELEARLDAERAAKKAGYPIIGYVHSIEKM